MPAPDVQAASAGAASSAERARGQGEVLARGAHAVLATWGRLQISGKKARDREETQTPRCIHPALHLALRETQQKEAQASSKRSHLKIPFSWFLKTMDSSARFLPGGLGAVIACRSRCRATLAWERGDCVLSKLGQGWGEKVVKIKKAGTVSVTRMRQLKWGGGKIAVSVVFDAAPEIPVGEACSDGAFFRIYRLIGDTVAAIPPKTAIPCARQLCSGYGHTQNCDRGGLNVEPLISGFL